MPLERKIWECYHCCSEHRSKEAAEKCERTHSVVEQYRILYGIGAKHPCGVRVTLGDGTELTFGNEPAHMGRGN